MWFSFKWKRIRTQFLVLRLVWGSTENWHYWRIEPKLKPEHASSFFFFIYKIDVICVIRILCSSTPIRPCLTDKMTLFTPEMKRSSIICLILKEWNANGSSSRHLVSVAIIKCLVPFFGLKYPYNTMLVYWWQQVMAQAIAFTFQFCHTHTNVHAHTQPFAMTFLLTWEKCSRSGNYYAYPIQPYRPWFIQFYMLWTNVIPCHFNPIEPTWTATTKN